MGINPGTPNDRNLGSEFRGIAKSSQPIIDLNKQIANYQVDELYPKMMAAQQRANDQSLQSMLSAGASAQKSFDTAAPEWRNVIAKIGEQVDAGAIPRTQGLHDTMLKQAQDGLALGGQLSPNERRMVNQNALQGFANRGMAMSNPAMFTNALELDQYSQQRNAARQQFAQSAAGQDEAVTQNWRNWLPQAGEAAKQGYMAINNMVGQLYSRQPASVSDAGSILAGGANIINPIMQYAGDLNNTNYNAHAAAKISGANNMAGIYGALIQSAGEAASSAAMACWVAREVFGEHNVEWAWFREWMLWHAPEWFRQLYLRHGERFARWLKGHPRVKRWLRPLMMARVTEMRQRAKNWEIRKVYSHFRDFREGK